MILARISIALSSLLAIIAAINGNTFQILVAMYILVHLITIKIIESK